jgi:hypothetical protein
MERISRKDDENLYQPRLHSKRIHQLYKLSQELNLPMTVLLDTAVEFYLTKLYDADISISCDRKSWPSATEPGFLVEGEYE